MRDQDLDLRLRVLNLSLLPGELRMYAGAAAPTGWLLCNGAAVSRTGFAQLFAVIGTTYGVGDGSTTFNVPDTRSRVPVGAGQGGGLSNRVLGTTGGEENHVLSVGEMPAHAHGVNDPQHAHGVFRSDLAYNGPDVPSINMRTVNAAGAFIATTTVGTGISILNNGSGVGHNVMQPWLAVNYIIKT